MHPSSNQPGGQFPTGYFVTGPQGAFPPGVVPSAPSVVENGTGQQGTPMVQLGQQYMPVSQAFQWSPDVNLLREISSRGAGAYRIHMTVGQPPQGYPQAFPHPQAMAAYSGQQPPHFFQEPGRLPGGYYAASGVDAAYLGQPYTMPAGQLIPGSAISGGSMIGGLPHVPRPQPVQAVDEARNPILGQSVSIFQASKGEPDTSIESSRRKSRKRKRNDPDRPKPARYAWNFFFKEKYQKLRNGGGSGLFDVQEAFTKIGLKLGNAWKALTPEERQPYLDMAAKDKQRYEREMEKYKAGLFFKDSSKDDDQEDEEAANDANPPKVAAGEKKEDTEVISAAIGNDNEKDVINGETLKLSEKVEIETGKDKNENLTQVTADILVTDDDENFIFLMKATLRRLHTKFNGAAKLDIHVAKNGQEAINKIVNEQHKYAVITMDKEMGPNSPDGFQTVKTIREAGYNGYVLGLTGNEGCEEKFQENGANATLSKASEKLYSQIYNIVIEKLNDQGERDLSDKEQDSKDKIEEAQGTKDNLEKNHKAKDRAENAQEKAVHENGLRGKNGEQKAVSPPETSKSIGSPTKNK